MKEFTFTRTYKSPIEVNIGDTFYRIGLRYLMDEKTGYAFRIASVVEVEICSLVFDCCEGVKVIFNPTNIDHYAKRWSRRESTELTSFEMLDATVEEWLEWNKKDFEKYWSDVNAAPDDIYDICTMFLYTDKEKAQQAVNEINKQGKERYEKIRKDNPDMPMWEDIK